MKVDLMETSAVGIPAYPDAHLSFIKSLKSLTNSSLAGEAELNSETESMEENEVPKEEVPQQEEQVEEKVEEAESKTEEAVEEEKEEPQAEEAVEESKSITESNVKAIVKDAITEALREIKPQRGLVDKSQEEDFKKLCKEASVGELALASGLFQLK